MTHLGMGGVITVHAVICPAAHGIGALVVLC
jgi:hypothetical protein